MIIKRLLIILTLLMSTTLFANAESSDPNVKEALKQQSSELKNKPKTAVKDAPSFAYKTYIRLYSKTKRFANVVALETTRLLFPLVMILVALYMLFLGIKTIVRNEQTITFLSKMLFLFGYLAIIMVLFIEYDKFTGYIFDFSTGLGVKILTIATQDNVLVQTEARNGLEMAFKVGDVMVSSIDQITERFYDQTMKSMGWVGNVGRSVAVGLTTFLVSVIFMAVYCAFVIVWTLASITMVLFFAIGRPLLLLSIFPPLRRFLFGWAEAIVTFIFTLIFVSLAMGLTIFTLADTIFEFNALIADKQDLPANTFLQLILIGSLSLFFHIKASSQAAMITKAHVQDFGQTFVAMGSVAGGVALKHGETGALIAGGMAAKGGKALAGKATELGRNILNKFN